MDHNLIVMRRRDRCTPEYLAYMKAVCIRLTTSDKKKIKTVTEIIRKYELNI
jgi:hypothetical protein